MFIFKHKDKEHEASMPDPIDDPITYEMALDEVFDE